MEILNVSGAKSTHDSPDIEEGRDFDLVITSMLVRPAGIGARYFGTGAPNNAMGFSDAAYDAALARGDEQAAAEALQRNPAALVLLRRERLVALDARIQDPSLGEWGVFDRLPEWTVRP